MHYYKRNIGDYCKKAGRLSMLQHGAYTLLIDACYDREIFPTEEDAIDWCWACSDAEIEAVSFILRKFFLFEDGRYIQKRISEDLEKYHQNAATNKRIANERETKRRNKRTKRDEAPPNHKPLTTNHKPDKEKPFALPKEIDQQLWKSFVDHRVKLKAPMTPKAMTLLANKILKFADDGEDIEAVINQSIESGWKTIYPVKREVSHGTGKQSSAAAVSNKLDELAAAEIAKQATAH